VGWSGLEVEELPGLEEDSNAHRMRFITSRHDEFAMAVDK
jgi:hypothetical protein